MGFSIKKLYEDGFWGGQEMDETNINLKAVELYIESLFDIVIESEMAWEEWYRGDIGSIYKKRYDDFLEKDTGKKMWRAVHRVSHLASKTQEDVVDGMVDDVLSYVDSELKKVESDLAEIGETGNKKILFWRRRPSVNGLYKNKDGDWECYCRLAVTLSN